MLEQIERAATSGAGPENVECVIAHDFSNMGVVYIRSFPEDQSLFAIAFDFQPRHCEITLCGEVFEDVPSLLQGESRPSFRVQKSGTQRSLPGPQLVFGVLCYNDDARVQRMLGLVASAADALADAPANPRSSLLLRTSEIRDALAPARRALDGESNDGEHDALYGLAETLGGWLDLAVHPGRCAASDSRMAASARIGELLLDAAERNSVTATTRDTFIAALAASDLDGFVRRVTERS
jgi:hypothetical protein